MSEPDTHALGNLEACLARSAALHQHLCPRQVLGVRMGLHAGELLGLELPQSDKRLLTLIETDGCLADGVSAATGCWLGRRTLRLIDFGKVAATFIDTHTERAVRIWPRPDARQRVAAYTPAAGDAWQAQLAAYQTMPSEDLLCADAVTLTISLAALISHPGRRVTCAGCGEEIMNQREVHIGDQVFCRGCASGSYYSATDAEAGALAGAGSRPPARALTDRAAR